jgi:hypothetical protein
MLQFIRQKSDLDPGLSKLIGTVMEYAEIYSLSKNRQRGCDGMGEAAALKEELRAALENMMNYCRERGYITDEVKADPDMLVREFMRHHHEKMFGEG